MRGDELPWPSEGEDLRERESAQERESVCLCETERERERESDGKDQENLLKVLDKFRLEC